MGARGSVSITRGGKPKKRSRFSPSHSVERGRIMAGMRRRRKGGVGTGVNRRLVRKQAGRVEQHHLNRSINTLIAGLVKGGPSRRTGRALRRGSGG